MKMQRLIFSFLLFSATLAARAQAPVALPRSRTPTALTQAPMPLPQSAALVNTSASPHATLHSVNMGEVQWTRGFWADRFAICRDSMIPHLWRIYHDPKISHAFTNFEIAAGLDTGSHVGPPFHDGDFYKLLEGVAAVYAITKDKHLDTLMDQAISVIARCQRPDGYIHTPTIIEERNHPGQSTAFEDRLNFETYNMGHLMTATCVHYRATGNPVYLQLAANLIDIRGLVTNGTDDNQDRVPFRSQTTAMGHAVRANYLYAGVADLVAETGDDSLWHNLSQIWADVTNRKMYITGGCGALYDGISPDATSYNPAQIQEVHQAYGRDYQLPNTTAHNETCANIGNLLWNWRMLLVSGQARYADVLEQALYNSVLSGVSLDGNRYFYTNPLRASRAFPYDLRWSGGRKEYIALSNCCPPNLARTMAEVSDYMYSLSSKGLWVNLYGGNILATHLSGETANQPGAPLRLSQQTGYPWDGKITLTIQQAPAKAFSIFLRIPGWCHGATLTVNGQPVNSPLSPSTYAEIHRTWKPGDIITLNLPMPAVLITANPLVEETRGQVAVRRGPVVYCLESPDLGPNRSIFDIAMPLHSDLHPVSMTIGNSRLMALEGTAKWTPPSAADSGKLYHEISMNPQGIFPSG
jgi:hypothetical protein